MYIEQIRSAFLWIADTSFEASVTVCLLLLVRWIFKKRLTAKWQYILWLIVIVRLLMPFTLPSPTSIFNVVKLPSLAGQTSRIVEWPKIKNTITDSRKTKPSSQTEAANITPHKTASHPVRWSMILTFVWLTVTALLTLRIMIGNYRLSRRVSRQRPVTNQATLDILEDCKQVMGVHVPMNVVESPEVKSPALLGFIRPRLLLPAHLLESFDAQKLKNIFMHELAHLKRGDVVLNWITSFLQIIHWFNPLLWVAFSRMRAEREIACDSLVMSYGDEKESNRYGETLIHLLEYSNHVGVIPSIVGIVEDKKEIKRRVAMIAQHKKDSHRGAMLAVTLLILVGIVGLTSAQSTENVPPKKENQIPTAASSVNKPSLPETTEAQKTKPPVTPRREGKIVVALNPLSSSSALDREQDAVSSIMQAELSLSEYVTLVEREQMHRILNEMQLGQQGVLAPESARKLGEIVGARYFCSGDLKTSGGKVMAMVKIIDIQTTLTKLAYQFLTSEDDAVEAGKSLAQQVEDIIALFEGERIIREEASAAKASHVAAKEIPSDWIRPKIMVMIKELHIRQPQAIDPAGETEVIKRLIESHFRVVDSEYVGMMKTGQQIALLREKSRFKFTDMKTASEYAAKKGADILLYGEAVSERAAGLGEFEGCRARIEVKAIHVQTDEILIADRSYGGATDLSEVVAGKKAIQQAANTLADRLLYDLAEKWNAALAEGNR